MSRLIATAAVLLCAATGWSNETRANRLGETRDLIVCGADRPLFVRLHIRVDRSGYRDRWEANIQQLFGELDNDDDLALDAKEAERMPSPQQFQPRRFYFFGPRQAPKSPQAADRDKDGMVRPHEFAQYIREAGGGEFGAQTTPDAGGQSPALDAALFKRLDANQNGKLEASEFALSTALRKLDTDDDETISLAEINPLLFSPYASVLQQPKPGSDVIQDLTGMQSVGEVAKSLLDRYGEASDVSNQKQVRFDRLGDERTFAAYDANEDGRLDNNELMALVKDPPITSELTVWMGEKEKAPRVTHYAPDEAGPPELNATQAAFAGAIRSLVRNVLTRRPAPTETGPLSIDSGTDRINFAVSVRSQYGRRYSVDLAKQQFSSTDRDNNEYLTMEECRRNAFLAGSFKQMDTDGDGKIFEPELETFVDKQQRLAACRALVSVTDQGHNVFGTFDSNHDGRITQRELRNAVERIETWDRNDDGAVELSEIPRQLKLAFSQGDANPFGVVFGNQIAQRLINGRTTILAPSWFRKMDRNRDSDLSPREFLGPKADFKKLDLDSDGLVSAAEANRGL